jgi:hypothetical protein
MAKKPVLSESEKLLRQAAKDRERAEIEQRKLERAEKKRVRDAEKEARRIKRENPPTEEELVKKYVNRVMNNEKYHGRIDTDKFEGIAYEKKENKNLWMDNDFFFSVVFESAEQKIDFIDSLGVDLEDAENYHESGRVSIINGIKFAEKLGVKLEREKSSNYPTGNLDLRPYIMDNESL